VADVTRTIPLIALQSLRDMMQGAMSKIGIKDEAFSRLQGALMMLDDLCGQPTILEAGSMHRGAEEEWRSPGHIGWVDAKERLVARAHRVSTNEELRWRQQIEEAKSRLTSDNPAYAALDEVQRQLEPKYQVVIKSTRRELMILADELDLLARRGPVAAGAKTCSDVAEQIRSGCTHLEK